MTNDFALMAEAYTKVTENILGAAPVVNSAEDAEGSSARPSRPAAANFDPTSYILVDRGFGAKSAHYIESANEVKQAIAGARKFPSPQGINIWEDSEGNIIIKVK